MSLAGRTLSRRVQVRGLLYSELETITNRAGYEGGILACPITEPGTNTASYQIFAKTPAFNWTNCTEVIGLLPHVASSQDFGAWEYA
jgi:hypothetical protein